MKFYRPFAWIMALSLTGTAMTACQSDELEPETSVSTEAVKNNVLYACVIDQTGARSVDGIRDILFTEDDIEWFNTKTREIKFRDNEEPLYKRLKPFHEIEIHLGDDVLFVVSSFVGLWYSQIFTDLVLCYGNQETVEIDGKYYLYDCYPLQFADSDEVKANVEAKTEQWSVFTSYLKSKGKLR